MYGDRYVYGMDVYVWRQVGDGRLCMVTGRRWTSMYGDRYKMIYGRQVGDGRLCMATGRRWTSMYGDK